MSSTCLAVLPSAWRFVPAWVRTSRRRRSNFNRRSRSTSPQVMARPTGPVQLVECAPSGTNRVFAAGQWYEFGNGRWNLNAGLRPQSDSRFVFAGQQGQPLKHPFPGARFARSCAPEPRTGWSVPICASRCVKAGTEFSLPWPERLLIRQIAISPHGVLHAASSDGLLAFDGTKWQPVEVLDGGGRAWAVGDVLGVAFDSKGQLWFAVKAGVGCQRAEGWRFYEGKDGLPWNDFSGVCAGADGEVLVHHAPRRYSIDGKAWQYRQGRRWLPHDDVAQAAVDAQGTAWFATAAGIGCIERRPMTLAAKAEFYEQEIERYIKRSPFGYVAEAPLRRPGDKTSADPQDSDNDGLWTAMYGAGECFAYGATKDLKAKERAKKAFGPCAFCRR